MTAARRRSETCYEPPKESTDAKEGRRTGRNESEEPRQSCMASASHLRLGRAVQGKGTDDLRLVELSTVVTSTLDTLLELSQRRPPHDCISYGAPA